MLTETDEIAFRFTKITVAIFLSYLNTVTCADIILSLFSNLIKRKTKESEI